MLNSRVDMANCSIHETNYEHPVCDTLGYSCNLHGEIHVPYLNRSYKQRYFSYHNVKRLLLYYINNSCNYFNLLYKIIINI